MAEAYFNFPCYIELLLHNMATYEASYFSHFRWLFVSKSHHRFFYFSLYLSC